MLKDKQYVRNTSELTAELFVKVSWPLNKSYAEGHYIQNKEKKLRVRVLFATSALGMGVDAP